jgi:RimJ/RimL family protein N-acetyltransferase
VELRTERLQLRPWRPDDDADVAAAFDIYRRDEVARWLGAAPKPWPSEEATRERLARWSAIDVRDPGYGMWAVVPDDVGRPVGTVLLVRLPDAEGEMTDDVEVGWHVHPDHWGHGYATEASRALLDHAFGTLGLTTVNAVAYAGNEPSFAVMRRLGMTRRGTTDRWYGVTLEWWSVSR